MKNDGSEITGGTPEEYHERLKRELAKFGKIVKRTKKLYAHDEKNQCAIGDLVRVEETRPLSRLKRWQLVEVLKH